MIVGESQAVRGKTAVTDEMSVLLHEAGLPHAFVDVDGICVSYPELPDDPKNFPTLIEAYQRASHNRSRALKPGDEILEIGPGWGAWFEYASRRGVKCTGNTI